jgi:hypothetical protein
MPTYQNSPERYPVFRRQLLSNIIIATFILSVGIFCICYFSGDRTTTNLYISIFVVFIFIVVFGRALAKNLRLRNENYTSYTLTIGPDHLTSQGNNLPATTLYFNEITKIDEKNHEVITITGRQPNQTIKFSSYLEDYGSVKDQLQTIQPITSITNKTVFEKYPFLFFGLIMFSIALVYISKNKFIVLIAGLFVLAILGRNFYRAKTKPESFNFKRSLILMIVAALSILSVMYSKVFGFHL